MYSFKNLAEVEAALEPFWPRNIRGRQAYTLDHMRDFMDFLGNPQDHIPAIHVAGTSGKTSTAYYAAALLKAVGKRVGLLISPHLEHISERAMLDLVPLPERRFCQEFAIFLDLADKSKLKLTYAEILYGFGYWVFARERVDYMVIETGMGGLLDATNVITRKDKICVITDIGFDHTHALGRTLTEIAAHKAGIIGANNVVFCYRQDEPALQVIESVCRQRHADLHVLMSVNTHLAVHHLPFFQQRNFGLAVEAVDFALERFDPHTPTLSDAHLRQAAEQFIPGRMEMRYVGKKRIIFDSAHNGQKMCMLAQSLAAEFAGQKGAVLIALTAGRGRDPKDTVTPLTPLITHCITTRPPKDDVHEWYDPQELAGIAAQAGLEHVDAVDNYKDALRLLLESPEPLLLVTGSLYLYQYIRPLTSDMPL
ncbi:MAG TPA: hypothetical protein VF733_04565 [Candidatus Saccharimonadales bacterium]